MSKKLVSIDKIHILLEMLKELDVNDPRVQDIKHFVMYEILEEDKQNINEIKRMYYRNMMEAKEKGDMKTYQFWYVKYQELKEM